MGNQYFQPNLFDDYIGVRELSQILGTNKANVYRWARIADFPSERRNSVRVKLVVSKVVSWIHDEMLTGHVRMKSFRNQKTLQKLIEKYRR